ncbi:MAG: AraC family transcriptional regulator, transcriptional activator for feuABC-ybbA operon [Acidobacteriota bacterium]|nr:AraC family transcriptional regulator, transcriptional activator for feuABC-ybbA operon [Acidobacteriota bacterium]
MKEDLRRQLTSEQLSRAVNLSPVHLRYLFKADTGMSFAQYLKSLRMEEAGRLLESTFLSIKEVMYRIGMRDESHFARDFKKTHGLAPAQYRARHIESKRRKDLS